ncbi:hypothetical protein BDA96_07G152700, partial [Sorghum bicolor]
YYRDRRSNEHTELSAFNTHQQPTASERERVQTRGGQTDRDDEGRRGGDDAGGAERGHAAPGAVAVQSGPGRAQDAHAARVLLPGAGAGGRHGHGRRRRPGGLLRAGAAGGGAGQGAGAVLPAGGEAGRRRGRPPAHRLQRPGRALRRRQGRLRRRGRVRRRRRRLRAVAGGQADVRAVRAVRRPALRHVHVPGDVPQVRRRGARHGHPPRDHGRHGRVPLHADLDRRGAGPRRRRGVRPAAAVPRPDAPPRALPADAGLRPPGLLAVPAQRPAPPLRHPRVRRLAEAPRRRQVPLRAGRVHVLRRHRAPVALHVRGARAGAVLRHAAPRPGQRPPPPPPGAPAELLRQRHRARPRRRPG